MAAGLRAAAKAAEHPPEPNTVAPVLDPTVRAANPNARREALTSRPLLLAAVGRATSHSDQTTLYLTPMHAEASLIKSMIANVHAAIRYVKNAAEQLPKIDRWATMLGYICQRIVGQTTFPTPPPALAG